MRVITVRYVYFRNLENAEINTDARDVILAGLNGQGKSNFLESLYYAVYLSSFRGANEHSIVRNGERNFSIELTVANEENTDRLLVKYENGKKTLLLNNKKIISRKEIIYLFPCIIFCHEDMDFVSGSMERRRWFFDQNLSLYNALYLDDLQRYKKLLKTKNTILKECKENKKNYISNSENFKLLDSVDVQLVEYGLRLMKKRSQEAVLFSSIFEDIYEKVSGIDGVKVNYTPSWKTDENNEANADSILSKIRDNRDGEVIYGAALSGPHRDHYVFTREDHDFVLRASTGQRRLLSLLLRCGQALRYFASTGKKPLLLFDDVLLELDVDKRRKFLECMPSYDQAFYTFLPDEPFSTYGKDESIIYDVENGRLTRKEMVS